MASPARPPLAKGLVVASKVFATLAGAGGVIGGVACGVALAGPPDTGAFDYSGPAVFGFFLLIFSAALAYVALTLYSLGVAADPAAEAVPRAMLGLGGALGALSVVIFALQFSDSVEVSLFWESYPVLPGAGLALMVAGAAMHLIQRRSAQ